MVEDGASWTGEWAQKSLNKHNEVVGVRLLEPQLLEIYRRENGPFLAGTIATTCVKPSSIYRFFESQPVVEFIANIPAESYWTGEAMEFAERRSVGHGGLGDLLSAVNWPDVRCYKREEFAFVERGLRQHTNVFSLHRVHDRKYVITRCAYDNVIVVLMNEYELTADHVRTARDRYGAFTDVLITNPNGKPTSPAIRAAESMECQVFKWGPFFRRLNLP